MSPKVLETCLTGFLASLAALNSDCRFKDYELCLGAVEKALARIADKDLGSAPISFSSANCAEYIQAYFYPLRVSEEEVLSFTYRIYRNLFGEVFGFMACARRKMTELFTADEHMSSVYKQGVVSAYLQVLKDRENEVFSMGLKGADVPLSDLKIGYCDRKKLFRIPAPTQKDMENMAIQSFLDGFTGKK